MIALLTTYLIVAYILIPGVLFRLPASFFVQLRLFQLSKTEEATLGCFVSVMPFLLALFFVWHVPPARNHPFPYSKSYLVGYRDVYRHALTVIVAEDPSRLLEAASGKRTVYEESLVNIEHRQMRFLSWYYLFIVVESVCFGFLTCKYGDWSENSAYDWFARKVMLPRVSEWQLLLTDFTFPKKEKRDVLADVLCGDHLYRGRVGEYFLNKSGDLSGILMKEVERFRRKDYEEARSKAANESLDREQFWRKIPGANFYVPAGQITNVNLRFPYASNSDLTNYLIEVLKRVGVNANVTVEPESSKTADEG